MRAIKKAEYPSFRIRSHRHRYPCLKWYIDFKAFVSVGCMAGYNLTRTVEDVLDRFDKDPNNQPSFTVHLHVEYWTLNSGSKFLYNNPVAVSSAFIPSKVFASYPL